MDGVATEQGAAWRAPSAPPVGTVAPPLVTADATPDSAPATPPPAPMVPRTTQVPPGVTPVWSPAEAGPRGRMAANAAVADMVGTAGPERTADRGRRWSAVAVTFGVALFGFYLLQAAVAFLSWYDAAIRTPGQADAMVAWAVCAGLVVPALILRGRWRALPIVVATLAGAVAPILLSRDLVAMLGVPDVWVGQGLTLQVLFPLFLGVPAAVAALLSGGRRR